MAFRDRQISMRRKTTCTCNACINIPSLDLKFIAHHGDYIIQHIANTRELVGSDVNLVHRLLKNHVADSTGWRAYMMLTEQCLEHLTLQIENATIQMEEYEHLGEVKTYNIDLHVRYKEITDERRILIDEKDADVVNRIDFATPPHMTWEWMQDPLKRNLWGSEENRWYAGDRPKGRTGKGMSNHCAHGKGVSTEVALDWRPFEYSTIELFDNGKKNLTQTIRLEPLPNGGTRVHDLMQMSMPLPHFLRRIVAQFMMKYIFKYDQALQKAARLAEEEYNNQSVVE